MTSDKTNGTIKIDKFLEQIAVNAQVQEGKEIVRAALREIYKNGTIGTKTLARRLYLPIPTIAALRQEMEKEGLITRVKHGAILTEKGLVFVTKELGINFLDDLICKKCEGTTIELLKNSEQLIRKLHEYMELRPKPLTNLDQAFGKPITALRRAIIMLQNGDIENRSVLLLGDDDFTSLAIALLNVQVSITVIDIDNRLLEIISLIAKKENYKIKCIKLDLKKPIPKELENNFDTIITDPPYTITGLSLFLSRATQAIKKEKNKKIYLSYAHRDSNITKEIQQIILNHGFVIQNIIPGFNLYEGAEIFGNTTALLILTSTDQIKTLIIDEFNGDIYTGELNPSIRIYKCINGHEIYVGSTQEIKTIEDLKEKGCPICENRLSFKRIRTIHR